MRGNRVTDKQIQQIKALLEVRTLTDQQIADMMKLSVATISRIKNNTRDEFLLKQKERNASKQAVPQKQPTINDTVVLEIIKLLLELMVINRSEQQLLLELMARNRSEKQEEAA